MKGILSLLLLALGALPAWGQDEPKPPTKTTQSVWRACKGMPDGGHFVHFVPLDKLRGAVKRDAVKFFKSTAGVTLPIDWAKSYSFPMYLNDQYGDCYYAAGCHADNTWTANATTKSDFSLSAIKSRYFALSGGDNGLADEDMQGEMMNRYLADVAQAKIVSWADIDPTDANACQSALADFGVVVFTLGVPNAWINNSDTGAVWDAGTANPNNGHAVIFNGCRAQDGAYTLQTWGTYVWITPRGVKSCLPAGWVAFSARWFNAKGYAPNGKHITTLAATWQQATGKTIPASVINSFPPPGDNPPTPPVPPTPNGNGTLLYTLKIPGLPDVSGSATFPIPSGAAPVSKDMTLQQLFELMQKNQKPEKSSRIDQLERDLGRMVGILENHQRRLDKIAYVVAPGSLDSTNALYTGLYKGLHEKVTVQAAPLDSPNAMQIKARAKRLPAVGLYTNDWTLIDAAPFDDAKAAEAWVASKL